MTQIDTFNTFLTALDHIKIALEAKYPDPDVLTIHILSMKNHFRDELEKLTAPVVKKEDQGSLAALLKNTPEAKMADEGINPNHYKHVNEAINDGRILEHGSP